MTDKQDQRVGNDAQAIQAGGNVVINNGLSTGQLVQIIDAVSRQIQTFTQDAHNTINQRLEDFKKEVLERLSHDPKARSQAFSDPDFQHALYDAQKAYARTADADLHRVLVDLIVERSKQEKRDRLALTLNAAIEKASALTDEDFSILALAFAVQRVQFSGLINLANLVEQYKTIVDPLVDRIPKSETAFSYLESQGCITRVMGGFKQTSSFDLLKETYPTVLSKGISEADFAMLFPEGVPQWFGKYFAASPFDKDRLAPQILSTDDGTGYQSGLAPSSEVLSRYAALAKAAPINREEFIEASKVYYPRVRRALDTYDNSPIRNARLTLVGIALAHAYLSKIGVIRADLAIWIH